MKRRLARDGLAAPSGVRGSAQRGGVAARRRARAARTLAAAALSGARASATASRKAPSLGWRAPRGRRVVPRRRRRVARRPARARRRALPRRTARRRRGRRRSQTRAPRAPPRRRPTRDRAGDERLLARRRPRRERAGVRAADDDPAATAAFAAAARRAAARPVGERGGDGFRVSSQSSPTSARIGPRPRPWRASRELAAKTDRSRRTTGAQARSSSAPWRRASEIDAAGRARPPSARLTAGRRLAARWRPRAEESRGSPLVEGAQQDGRSWSMGGGGRRSATRGAPRRRAAAFSAELALRPDRWQRLARRGAKCRSP